jgi:hypothetical protein
VFGGAIPAAFERVARWGYRLRRRLGASAHCRAGLRGGPGVPRPRGPTPTAGGHPYLVAVAYFALGDTEQGQANVWDYYNISGDEIARLITNGVAAGPARVRDTVAAFADIGADELILNPTVGDLEEITRLADIVL